MAKRKRRVSKRGVKFVAEFEGFPNNGRPYNDPAGYATVGYGHLLGYRPVRPSDHRAIWIKGQETPGRLTKKEARKLLRRKLNRVYAEPVRRLFRKDGHFAGKFKQHRFDALVSFAFNLGVGSVTPGTTGFETMGRALRSGSIQRVADAMLLYDWAGGRRLAGLTRRRRAERALWRRGKYVSKHT